MRSEVQQGNKLKGMERSFATESSDDGSIWELCLFAIFFVLIFSAIARAEAPASSSAQLATSMNSMKKTSAFTYSGALTIETTSTLSEEESTSYGGWYNLVLKAKHVPSKISASLVNGFSQEYSYEREHGTEHAFDNPILSVTKSLDEGEEFRSRFIDTFSYGLRGSLPANRDAYKKTFLGSIGPQIVVAKQFGRVSLRETLRYTRSFFEYDITDAGAVNAPDSFSSTTETGLDVTDSFSFSASLSYAYAISFQNVGKASQIAQISADYRITDRVTLSGGVATERGTLDPDGQTNSIKFFDENVSQAFVDLVFDI